MPADAFSFTLDHAQSRLAQDRLATLRSGFFEPDFEQKRSVRGWDDRWGTVDANSDLTTWVDEVTGTLMLRPASMLQAWRSTFTGIYARLAKADFTLTNASKWVNHNTKGASGDYWLHGVNLTDEGGVTTTSWAKNRGFSIGGLTYSTGQERTELHCGWNSSASGSSGVSLRLFSDGDVEVWKDGAQIEKGNAGPKDAAKTAADGAWLGFWLIPFGRGLLVVSTLGGGFFTLFEDIDEDDPDPTITGATNFWFYVPGSVRTMTLQIAPIRYPTTGYRACIPSFFPEAPAAAEVPEVTVYYETPGYGSQTVTGGLYETADPTTVFTPDGTTRECRCRVDLTGDNESTPFVFGIQAEFPTLSDLTDDSEETVLDSYIRKYRISVSEDPGGTSLSLELNSPQTIEDAAGPIQLRNVVNRPLKVDLGPLQVLDLFTDPPQIPDAVGDDVVRWSLTARDRWKALEQYRFQERTPLDGLTLKEAFTKVCEAAGMNASELDVEDVAFTLPATGRGSSGDWSVAIEAGDTAADWLLRLKDSYAGNWFLSFVPDVSGPILRFRSPDDLGEDPVLTIYASSDDAIAGGIAAADARNFVYRSFCESSLEPECNDIMVLGMDPRTRRPIASHKSDMDAQDPTLAPSARPENWVGEKRRYGFVEPHLSTQDACDRCCELLYSRLTPRRYMAEWDSELLINPDTGLPLWKGDVITIDGHGDYRITTLCFEAEREPTSAIDFVWREARYTAEQIVAETAKGCGQRTIGTTVMEMRAYSMLAIGSKTVIMPGGAGLEKKPAIRSNRL